MNTDDVLKEFEAAGALMKGHFVLTSGKHSDTYLNKSIVSMYPDRTEKLCRALAAMAKERLAEAPDFVVSPAMGAIIYGYETARHVGVPFMFLERVDGEFTLRRGFELPNGAKVLIVEDIVSTGLSAKECLTAVRAHGGEPLALACLIDRSGGSVDLDAPLLALAELNVPTYDPDALPTHLQGMPAVKPGSRNVSQ